MTREIRFRGRRLDNRQWVYGHYFTTPLTDENSGVAQGYGWCFLSDGTTRHCISQDGVAFVVEPSTVGQYTGLKDKNGKEIYEGDVVGAFCDTQRFEIKYCEERGGYFLDSVVLCGGAEPAPECLGNLLDTVEVIGNIHDNPELLEEVIANAREGNGNA